MPRDGIRELREMLAQTASAVLPIAGMTEESFQRSVLERLDAIDARVGQLERFADKAEGALTLVKFIASFLGLGGLAALIVTLSKGGL